MLFDEPGVVGSGGNSGFQAINIAAQFGASRILLIGFDMHAAAGVHWYGHNGWHNASNPSDYNYIHWRQALTKQSRVLGGMGIDVVNGSQGSALTCFRSSSVERTLMDWNL
jgi:alpha-glucuronidase